MFKRFSQSLKKSGCLRVQLTQQGEYVDCIKTISIISRNAFSYILLSLTMRCKLPLYWFTKKMNCYMVYKLCIFVDGAGL